MRASIRDSFHPGLVSAPMERYVFRANGWGSGYIWFGTREERR
jgi:hypothetical protein